MCSQQAGVQQEGPSPRPEPQVTAQHPETSQGTPGGREPRGQPDPQRLGHDTLGQCGAAQSLRTGPGWACSGQAMTSLRMSPERGYTSPGCTAVKSSCQAQGPAWPGLGETDPSERNGQLPDELSQGRQGRGAEEDRPGPACLGEVGVHYDGQLLGFLPPPFLVHPCLIHHLGGC